MQRQLLLRRSSRQILKLLEMRAATPGPGQGWVSKYEIIGMGHKSYRARILDLRRAGHQIESRRERVGKKQDTCYRLIKKAEAMPFPSPVAAGGGDAAHPRPEHLERPQIENLPADGSVGGLFLELRRWAARGNWMERDGFEQLHDAALTQEPGVKERGVLRRKDGAVEFEARFEQGVLLGDSLPANFVNPQFWNVAQALRFNGIVSARFVAKRLVRGDLWESFERAGAQ